MKFSALVLALGLSFSVSIVKADGKPLKQLYVNNYENVLGTSLEFKISSSSEKQVELAEQAALTEINRLSAILSSYDRNSEFNKWMTAGTNKSIKISAELFEMLNLFEQWKTKTNGALNISATVAGNLWAQAEKKQKKPLKAELALAVSQMQEQHYSLNQGNLTATRLDNVPLAMNTFTKSYIINKACEAALKVAKIDNIVINIGGDLVIKGDEKDLIYVTNPLASAENDLPLAKLNVGNNAVATSGNYRRGFQIGKEWYSHIINPKTAQPVNEIISATVIAPSATDAGALATAFNVLSINESKELAKTVEGAAYLIVTKNGKIIESDNWKDYLVKEGHTLKTINTPTFFNQAEKPWDTKYELIINFEFNAIQGNSHRPFVAIWVENDKREPVRNLALMYNKTKWVPDLKNWYRINGERFKADKENYASVTGATRNPGKYTIKWDGKDDNGNYVPQGNYTIIIETSKEHGTDEILRQPMELKKSAKRETNAGNVEISNVVFDFVKKK
ncbi:DUF2271 domain-containing protein [Pedobacter sp.]|uniref:DUF2271 domain-containing protein n=1 Tax=Pedobacter sp. TaxID=1411316 RepID=UPI00396D059B